MTNRNSSRRSPPWLAIAVAAALACALGGSTPPTARGATGEDAPSLKNPIEQRQEMIALLRSIDSRLATLEERLAPAQK